MSDDLTLHDGGHPVPSPPRPTITLHRAPCGCVGLHMARDVMLVFQPCDGDRDVSLFLRRLDADSGAWTEIAPALSQRLLESVQDYISDGYRYREIRSLLRVHEP